MRKVEAQINIAVPPNQALAAFTEHELLKGWWGVERSLVEKEPGGAYALAWGISEKGFLYVNSGVVEQYEPGRLLEIGHLCYFNPEREIMGGMKLTVEVSPAENGTLLTLCQDGYRHGGDWDWMFEVVTEAWPKVLEQLKAFLESL